jgi:hypothetical protein
MATSMMAAVPDPGCPDDRKSATAKPLPAWKSNPLVGWRELCSAVRKERPCRS